MPVTETLTPVETRCLEMVLTIQLIMARKRLLRPDYLELVTMLRDIKIMLQNKKYGCIQGMHGIDCTCTAREIGKTVEFLKRRPDR